MRRTVLLLASTALGLLLAFGVALVAVEHAAEASFPGKNGKIAFQMARSLHFMDSDGSDRNAFATDQECYDPAWSPDGSKLAMGCVVGDYTFGLATMNADGSGWVWIGTSESDNYGTPTWSPSGTQIAYSEGGAIWLANADGTGDPSVLTGAINPRSPDWSPDGTKIAFQSEPTMESNATDISVVNVGGAGEGSVRNLTNSAATYEGLPSWSPDGTKIAYSSMPTNSDIYAWDISVMNADGSNRSNLTETTSVSSDSPVWSPDGTKIAFARGDDIWTMGANGSSKTNLTNSAELWERESSPAWQPTCTMTGTPNSETLIGTAGPDFVCGGGGNDIIKGAGGSDILKGEGQNDKLFGGPGNDIIDGGLGSDTANFSGSTVGVSVNLVLGTATGEGSDNFVDVGNVVGSPKGDVLRGSAANNTIQGQGGDDSIVGSGGADSLFGQDGADAVNSKDGVNGNDYLNGGTGTDTKVTDATEKGIVGFP